MKNNLLDLKKIVLFGILFNAVAYPIYETHVKPEWITHAVEGNFKSAQAGPLLPNQIPADLAYWIADIKLDEQGVKIVEFGDGNYSGYKVLDHIHFRGKAWKDTWEYLFSIGVPIWFVGNYMNDPETVSWKTFTKGSNYYSQSIEALQSNKRFLAQAKKSLTGVAKTLHDYQGIIVLKFYRPSRAALDKFMQKYPNFLVLNESTTGYVRNKQLSDGLFTTPELKSFRPKSLILPKKYTKTLSDEIIKAMPDVEWFIIKPINSTRGNGIVMSNKNNLRNDLYAVLVKNGNNLPINNSYSYRPEKPQGYEYWQKDRNSHFLVEEYAESKPTIVNQKPYDATARVIFMMRYEQGKIGIDYIDAYWKRPLVALNEPGTFKEKHISKHSPNFEESQGLAMNAEDFLRVQESMNKMLPQVYWNLLSDYYADPV